MVILVVIFFIWVLFVSLIGGIIAWAIRKTRRAVPLQPVDNVEHEERLSFPQRNWLLLCVIVAIVSPIFVHAIHVEVARKWYNHSVRQRQNAVGTNNSDSEKVTRDTSYHVASPPQH
ncbi:MAG TPA: hypothetical protein VGR89_11435 [Puia sp.]|nr:hypothetical protein [Puia sp.]